MTTLVAQGDGDSLHSTDVTIFAVQTWIAANGFWLRLQFHVMAAQLQLGQHS